MIDAKDSDLFDVLEYVAYAKPPISRLDRVVSARDSVHQELDSEQQNFVDFVLDQYVNLGDEQLDQGRLPTLLAIKYQSQKDGVDALGGTERALATFVDFQRELYSYAAERKALAT